MEDEKKTRREDARTRRANEENIGDWEYTRRKQIKRRRSDLKKKRLCEKNRIGTERRREDDNKKLMRQSEEVTRR